MSDPQDWQREPGRGRYARAERERRFLVTGEVPRGDDVRLVEDRYLTGTTLRLRCITHGGRSVRKLTQKVRPDAQDPAVVLLTNLYLSAREHTLLAGLPADVVTKERSVVAVGPQLFVVDRFSGRLSGLLLAEVEVDDLDAPLALPPWVGPEVTHDDRFSGGLLAVTDAAQLAALLRSEPRA